MNNPMTYIQNGDYLIPDLKLSQQPEKTPGQVRQDEENLPEGTPSHPLQPDADEREVVPAPSGDRRDRPEQTGADDAPADEGSGSHRGTESQRSHEVGGLMNTCKAQAEEILMTELINS